MRVKRLIPLASQPVLYVVVQMQVPVSCLVGYLTRAQRSLTACRGELTRLRA